MTFSSSSSSSSPLSCLFFLFFVDNLMCRINAVGHFTQRQVHSVAGCSDDVTVMSLAGGAVSLLSGDFMETLQVTNRSNAFSAAAQRRRLISAGVLW